MTMANEPRADCSSFRVFAIPELLEYIILQLPQEVVLTKVMLVAPWWKQVIETSTNIQRRLFNSSSTEIVVGPCGFEKYAPIYDVDFELNPYLRPSTPGMMQVD